MGGQKISWVYGFNLWTCRRRTLNLVCYEYIQAHSMRSLIKQTISTNPVLMPLPGLLALILFNCLFLAACSYFYPLILPPVFSVEIFIYNLLPMLLFSLLC